MGKLNIVYFSLKKKLTNNIQRNEMEKKRIAWKRPVWFLNHDDKTTRGGYFLPTGVAK